MQISVYISATLRAFVNKQAKIEIEGETVREILQHLQDEYPESKNALFDENGALRPFVSVYLNDTRISTDGAWDSSVRENDTVLLLPSIAGGAPVGSVISDERRKEVSLDDSEIERFNKHLMLREIGVKGQKRIKAAKVLIIGLGALGAPVVQYLAAAGVGTIGIADSGEVSLGDLQSQVIHGTRDVHRPKIASARDSIKAINPKIKIDTFSENLDADNIGDIIADYDIVVDCTDNYRTRYLISDACALSGKPEVFGAVYQFEGQVSVFDAKSGPCFRCQFPSPPPVGLVPTCASSGIINTLPGIIGSIQANEVLKLIIGGGESLTGKLLVVDTWNNRTSIVNVQKDENCPVCGRNPSITEIENFDYEDFCGLKPDEDEIPVEGIEAEELVRRIEKGDPLTLVDVREPHERAIHRFPNAIVIPIGQLARRQKELDPDVDTIFICREGKRSILAINTLREAGYKGPMYNLKGGIEAAKNIIFSHEGAWL
ncbi:MAG: molybdopterin-synthase adenylyltransferase MoeB [Clostridia bacterium]|nr:molybdopterin-synthase adenylyltransferase MoeB [Clostridia bacterium]